MPANEPNIHPAAAAAVDPLATPFCGELRSKRYFMLDTLPTEPGQYFDPSGHCWCYHTQQAVGPDGGHAGPHECVEGRVCYRSALADDPVALVPSPGTPGEG